MKPTKKEFLFANNSHCRRAAHGQLRGLFVCIQLVGQLNLEVIHLVDGRRLEGLLRRDKRGALALQGRAVSLMFGGGGLDLRVLGGQMLLSLLEAAVGVHQPLRQLLLQAEEGPGQLRVGALQVSLQIAARRGHDIFSVSASLVSVERAE